MQTPSAFRVGPHPHIGLQTFSWMIAGEILHRDSLGYTQVLRPGQVNLMTAGRGISHSEEGVASDGPMPWHLAQLWIALPNSHRHIEPAFQHYPTLPQIELDGVICSLLAGQFLDQRSPVQVYSPLLGVDVLSHNSTYTTLPLQPNFEYGVLVLEGMITIEGESLSAGTLLYLGTQRDDLRITTDTAARWLLLGGEPMNEPVLLWWNFVARNEAEIITATADWNAGAARFGEVREYIGDKLIAPSLSGLRLRT